MGVLAAKRVLEKFRELEVTHVVGLPDNGSRALFALLDQDSGIEVVGVTREGEAFAVAAGLFAGGCQPLVLVQNTGLLESGDAFRGTLYNMGFPVLMLVGYRGYESLGRGPGRVDTAASFLEPTLKAWDIPYWMVTGHDELARFNEAMAVARERSLPAAILYPGETTE